MTNEMFQTGINLTKDDARMVDRMTFEDGSDNRSAFIRKLIRQEWARRHPEDGFNPRPPRGERHPEAFDAEQPNQKKEVI